VERGRPTVQSWNANEAQDVIGIEIGFMLLLSVAAGMVVWPIRRTVRGAPRGRALSVRVPEGGEIELRIRTPMPLSRTEWRSLQSTVETMARSLRRPSGATSLALEVSSLGPLAVRRNGVEINNWGGPKAGNRHALAIFAFLLDRGERGADKSEVVELVWPECDLKQADLAFHRTLSGLRRVLAAPEPSALRAVITTRDGVYRLDPTLVVWNDVDDFDDHLVAVETSSDLTVMAAHLDAARRLYRGDYMDDCPFYGDSTDVETRRQLLRNRLVRAQQLVIEAAEREGNPGVAGPFFRGWLEVDGPPTVADVGEAYWINPAA
jgi:two-component SAPR family response regulator